MPAASKRIKPGNKTEGRKVHSPEAKPQREGKHKGTNLKKTQLLRRERKSGQARGQIQKFDPNLKN